MSCSQSHSHHSCSPADTLSRLLPFQLVNGHTGRLVYFTCPLCLSRLNLLYLRGLPLVSITASPACPAQLSSPHLLTQPGLSLNTVRLCFTYLLDLAWLGSPAYSGGSSQSSPLAQSSMHVHPCSARFGLPGRSHRFCSSQPVSSRRMTPSHSIRLCSSHRSSPGCSAS